MVLWILPAPFRFHVRGFHPLWPAFPKPFHYPTGRISQSVTPVCTHTGLGSSAFARRYLRNRVFFLFLRVLRCFSSPGSPHNAMDSRYADGGLLRRVSPFRYLRINGYLLLPEAFRSLSRLSSALSAKASTLRSSSLDHSVSYSVTYGGSQVNFYEFYSQVFIYISVDNYLGCLPN